MNCLNCGAHEVAHMHIKDNIEAIEHAKNILMVHEHHCVEGAVDRCSFCLWQKVCKNESRPCDSYICIEPLPVQRFAQQIAYLFDLSVPSTRLKNPDVKSWLRELAENAINLRQEWLNKK